MDKDLRIAALEAENARHIERIDDLEKALFGSQPLHRPEWRLTPSEGRMYAVLATRDLVTKESALVALYDDHFQDRAEAKIVDVYVCKLRQKLKPFGIKIETVWGHGYRLLKHQAEKDAA